MVDDRFFQRQGPFSLAFLANTVDGLLEPGASGEMLIHDVAPLELADAEALSFFEDKRHAANFADTKAGACLVGRSASVSAPAGTALIRVDKPYLAFIRLAQLFYPEPGIEPGIDPYAIIDAAAAIGAGCRIEAAAVVGARAVIGDGCHIESHAVIGPGVVLGPACRIGAGVTISHAIIGARVAIWPGARIGQPGFGFLPTGTGLQRIPQLGRVVIHDDVEIGANTTIDRGMGGDTVIGPGCAIDNLVQIAHNVRLGRGCVIAGQAGISGSSTLGDHVMLGGQAGLSDHVKVGKGARVAAQAGIMRDVAPGTDVVGSPAVPSRQFFRQQAVLARLASKKGD